MKSTNTFQTKKYYLMFLSWILVSLVSIEMVASPNVFLQEPQEMDYSQYSGLVVDNQTGEPLVFASLSIMDSNISTITNTDGEFLIKVPNSLLKNAKLIVSTLGYQTKILPISDLKNEKNKIRLDTSVIKLTEVVFNVPKDAKSLVQSMLKLKKTNYSDKQVLMTAFYRETIKKRRKNASLAEAIVTVFKQPYTASGRDKVKLFKVRKSTDYSRLDTVALKLQGGPFNALYVDLLKYPNAIFDEDTFSSYKFSFAPSTTIDDRGVYVVKFIAKESITEPMYFGRLFIDAKTRALTSAIYNLDVTDEKAVSDLFVKRKPKNIYVYPTAVAYRIDYREKDGLWYYNYSNAQLTFKIDRKKKLFNSTYSISSEMAVTDWKLNTEKQKPTFKESMRKSIIISDEASGFSDPEFWGAYNVIEPEKSIETAIKKIRRQLTTE